MFAARSTGEFCDLTLYDVKGKLVAPPVVNSQEQFVITWANR
jgi:hypothetical protein